MGNRNGRPTETSAGPGPSQESTTRQTFRSIAVGPALKHRALVDRPRDIEAVPADLREVIRECCGGRAPWPLFIFGRAGTGKSCAALCLCDRVERSWFSTAEQLELRMMAVERGEVFNSLGYRVWPESFWRGIGAESLAVLDEIGCRNRATDTHYRAVKSFLESRFALPTILVSNLNPVQLEQAYDDRVASRVCSGTMLRVDGPDRRLAR